MTVSRRRLIVLLRAVVTLVLCAVVISRLDVTRLRLCLVGVNAVYIAAACLTVLSVMLLHSLKWMLIVRFAGRRLHLVLAVRATWGGAFVNHLLPGRLGGDVARAYAARDVTDGVAQGLGYLVLDRVSNLIAMLLTAAVVAPSSALPLLVRWAVVGLGVAAIPGLFIAAYLDVRLILRRFGQFALVVHACRLIQTLQKGMRNPLLLALLVVLGGCVMALVTLVNVLVGRALGITVGYRTFWAAVALAHAVTLLPVTIGGLGLREGLFAYLFESAGAALEQGMMLSLIARVTVMLCSLPGGVWLLMTESLPDIRSAAGGGAEHVADNDEALVEGGVR